MRLIGYGWNTRISLYLLVEYSSFGTLKDFHCATKATVSWSETLGYCQDVAIGLEALHGCVISHRDVKLENTLVPAKPGTLNYIIKLFYFGNALTCDNSRYLGTDLLNAPETLNRDFGALRSLERHFKSDMFSPGLWSWRFCKMARDHESARQQVMISYYVSCDFPTFVCHHRFIARAMALKLSIVCKYGQILTSADWETEK